MSDTPFNKVAEKILDDYYAPIKLPDNNRAELVAAILAAHTTAIREAQIEEVQALRKNQLDFVKAQSGHVRNNNNWPRNRGAGKAAKDAVDWLDKRIAQLSPKRENI